MEKNLPPILDSEILRQLAIEQLVEILIEQGTTRKWTFTRLGKN